MGSREVTTDCTLLGVRLSPQNPSKHLPPLPLGHSTAKWGRSGQSQQLQVSQDLTLHPNWQGGGLFPKAKVLANLFNLSSARLARANWFQRRSEPSTGWPQSSRGPVLPGLLQSTLPREDQVLYPQLPPLKSPLLSLAQQHCPQEGQPLACQPPWPEHPVHGQAARFPAGSPVRFPEPPCSPPATLLLAQV